MDEQADKSIAEKEEVKKSDLQPRLVFVTAIISSFVTLAITGLSDLLKSVHNANNLKPDNNVHIIALKATAAKSDCPLINSNALKLMASDPASMNHLSPIDQFSVVLFAKNIPATIQSNQISSTLLTELKTRRILDSKCDPKPLDTLNVALVVSQPTPYVFNRKCDVLSRLDHVFPPKYVNLGEVVIRPQAPGTTSTQQTKSQTADNEHNVNDGPYNVLKETGVSWASFSSVRVKANELTKMFNGGYLNVGLRCEFLYDKELKSKDIDYHKLQVNNS